MNQKSVQKVKCAGFGKMAGFLILALLLVAALPGWAATIWPSTTVPGLVDGGADIPVELGVKFKSDVAGNVTAIRFYKATANTGTHVGNLWSSTGTLLGSVTFTGETASGWQQMNLTSPVAITAGTTYVVSYHCNPGHYSADLNYFASAGVDNAPLHALANSVSINGVYAYGSGSVFPNQTWNAANYWVDVVVATGPVPLTVTTSSLPGGFFNTAYSSSVAASGGTTPYTWSITAGTLPGGLTLNATSGAITGTPTATGTFNFTVQATDASAPVQTATKALSIVVSAVPTTATIWPSTTVPGLVDGGPDSAVELGVKFTSDVAGKISGIRFYKATANTGTHVGNLWSSTGTLLGSGTFSNETASGWQQMNFASLVNITAGTVYVASYHANVGHYSADLNYFAAAGVDNPPLHALASGTSINGVYAYGASSAFPNQTWNAANYWVDPVFQSAAPATLNSIAVSPASPTNFTGTTRQFTATATYSDGSTSNLTSVATWASGSTGVATINSGGLASAVAVGTSTISATLGSTSGNTLLTVKAPPTLNSIAVTPANPTNFVGNTQQFAATGTYSDGSTANVTSQATWASSATGVATINGAGLATSTGAGGSSISATIGAVSGATTLTVKAPATLGSITVTPPNPTVTASGTQQFTATGNYSDGTTQNLTAQVTWSSVTTTVATVNAAGLASAVSAGTSTIRATLGSVVGSTVLTVQAAPLVLGTSSVPNGALNAPYSSTLSASGGTTPYGWTITAGALPPGLALGASSGTISGTPTNIGTFNFTVRLSDAGSPVQTVTRAFTMVVAPSTPLLVITATANPFTAYHAEIVAAEGLNEFEQKDISTVTSANLGTYDVAILGEMTLTAAQVTTISNWVTAGGKLIAMRPDKKLAGLLGLADAGATLTNGYMLATPSGGIVNQTIQYHGVADKYTLAGATSVATLYSTATAPTANPAVTIQVVGTAGGQAVCFTYDLARSVVYTRQGNPAWSGQERDGQTPIRSDDLFYGAAAGDPQPDWVDLNKIAIPQADEQQRLLANLITYVNSNRKLMPRFWYFPSGAPAVIVMTGDDHANGGTIGRFNQYTSLSPAGSTVADWTAIRSSSYVFPAVPMTDAQAAAFNTAGFEIGLHLDTGCANYTAASVETMLSSQLSSFHSKFPSLPDPTTMRVHCIAWSDYTTMAQVEFAHGIRMDTSYYYWPSNWVLQRPGMFTGSGIPMRYATTQGNIIDVFQAVTQMTDESGQSFPSTCDALLDKALGPEGYYGAFVANMHTDFNPHGGSDGILQSATARGVPIISAKQLLTWVDAKNASAFKSIAWGNNRETFTIQANASAKNLQAMVPVPAGLQISNLKFNGSAISFSLKQIKGVQYAFFNAVSGDYEVNYVTDNTGPTVTGTFPLNGAASIDAGTGVLAAFNEGIAPATINASTITLKDSANAAVAGTVAYNPASLTAGFTPNVPLGLGKSYTATVKGGGAGVTDATGNPMVSDFVWSFTTANVYSLWSSADAPGVSDGGPDSAVELGVKFKSDVAGTVTGIRFYKSAANTGTHIGSLWSSTGTKLGTATFTNETASGWQTVLFSSPLAISANTTYVASYHSNNGHYSADLNYFSAALDSPPLHALANSTSVNGVYAYGASSVFPNQTWNAANYWVDVMFKP
jgi:hypothetical protein